MGCAQRETSQVPCLPLKLEQTDGSPVRTVAALDSTGAATRADAEAWADAPGRREVPMAGAEAWADVPGRRGVPMASGMGRGLA